MKTWRKRLAAGLLTLVLGVSLVPGAFAASAYDCPGQKLAALTFDDGPGRYSAAILDTLKAHGAKATFFMNGYNIWIYASQVQRMVAEGHQVANHTYNHPDLVQSSDALVRQEVDSLAQALTQITGLKGTGNTSFTCARPLAAGTNGCCPWRGPRWSAGRWTPATGSTGTPTIWSATSPPRPGTGTSSWSMRRCPPPPRGWTGC